MAAGNTADRNLLFGILAVQMDFISREALLTGMNAWVLDKAKSLAEVLHRQGALAADDWKLIEPLVEKHLLRHGGDPARSLAALSSVEAAREGLGAVPDPDIQASLAHLGAASPGAARSQPGFEADAFGTRAPAPAATSEGTRFRILRPHARGGLGEVFVAEDGELHREVALKQIQDRHADNADSRARFLLEAEVTGGLEHPGIVPVYGLGSYADGRPFYAMRFIRGDSLK
jgi:eukaryotic-like serine/threonine-protein kinase